MEFLEQRERRGQKKKFEEILTIKFSLSENYKLTEAAQTQSHVHTTPLATHTHSGSYTKVHHNQLLKTSDKTSRLKKHVLRNKGENDSQFLIVNNTSEKILSNVFTVLKGKNKLLT